MPTSRVLKAGILAGGGFLAGRAIWRRLSRPEGAGYRDTLGWRLYDDAAEAADRCIGWDRLPTPLGLAALIGLSLGVIGGGGSILTVPIFVYVLGFDPKLAIAMSLPVVGGTSLIGAISHWKEGNVKLKMAALFGIIAMAGAYAGARLAIFLSGSLQLALLAIVMLIAAVSMFRSARRDSRPVANTTPETPAMPVGLLVPVALGVGLVTGLVGIGGGFLVVPALVVLATLLQS
jgi:hypothetical protein